MPAKSRPAAESKRAKSSFGISYIRLLPIVLLAYGAFKLLNKGPQHDHEMFLQAPSDHVVTLKSGVKTTIPFHSLEARSLLLVGLADGKVVDKYMQGQDYHAIKTPDGRALTVVWLMTYINGTGGPYSEIVLTFVTAKTPKTMEWNDNGFDILAEFLRPSHVLFIQKLWLNETLPIDYGIEVLGLNKVPMRTPVTDRDREVTRLDWTLPDGKPLIKVDAVTKPNFIQSVTGMFKSALALGTSRAMQLLFVPATFTWSTPKNLDPYTKTMSGDHNPRGLITGFGDIVGVAVDPTTDKFEFHGELAQLKFEPLVKQIAPQYAFIFFPPIVSPTALGKK
eukprot:TRINITY_DN5424_c0_g1_i1.p1 TRINITY_DN5424_c0_g1~~TRINITY_DN5424_c0_g1_i1.p1  ORF type:complete len:336 (+),score=62.31 TRINITY_DN5424_c0_g1_i1:114-1121(+)